MIPFQIPLITLLIGALGLTPSRKSNPEVLYWVAIDSANRWIDVEMEIGGGPRSMRLAMAVHPEYSDRFWDEYRATPRAYIRLEEGQELWRSRFGELTSIRLAPPGTVTPAALQDAANRFSAALKQFLKPAAGGFVFDEVKASALQASQGGTQFGMLFLYFSFFLILSALLLVGLLFRLNLDRRASQVGVLFAEGYPRATVRWPGAHVLATCRFSPDWSPPSRSVFLPGLVAGLVAL